MKRSHQDLLHRVLDTLLLSDYAPLRVYHLVVSAQKIKPDPSLPKCAYGLIRKEAGLTQRQLAQKLGREHSFVWRIEHGERRLDVVEFHWVCRCLDQDQATVYNELAKAFRRKDRRGREKG